jgi:hypothetical protein
MESAVIARPWWNGILAIFWQDFLSREWRIISVHLDSFVDPEWLFQILNLLQVYLEMV